MHDACEIRAYTTAINLLLPIGLQDYFVRRPFVDNLTETIANAMEVLHG